MDEVSKSNKADSSGWCDAPRCDRDLHSAQSQHHHHHIGMMMCGHHHVPLHLATIEIDLLAHQRLLVYCELLSEWIEVLRELEA